MKLTPPPLPKVLVVEDDGAIRDALSELLECSGYLVTAVPTAELGMAALRQERFSLLLTDYALPGECGGWLVRQGCAEGLLQGTVLVMITALLHPPKIEGVRVLRKPLEMSALLAEIARGKGCSDLAPTRATHPARAGAKSSSVGESQVN